MARSFRASRFRGNREIGEDVNPSAYIVNLADCMLVLACGFLVALISFWQIDLMPSVEKFEEENLEQIDPELLPEDIIEGGSYYVEAGTAYRDPNTGVLYIVKPQEESSGENASASAPSASADAESAAAESGTGSADSAGAAGGVAESAADDEIRAARATGDD